MTIREIAQALNDMGTRFEELYYDCLQYLCNEGANVGDAGNILELISNTCLYNDDGSEPHDSYRVKHARSFIAKFFNIHPNRFDNLCQEIAKLNTRKYVQLMRRVG